MLSLLAVTAALATASGGSDGTTIRFDGIGPLRLGMTLDQATRTGVLRSHTETCLDGTAPLPVVYGSDGPKAAPGASFTAYFSGDRLTNLMFTGGTRTTLGIRPGVSSGAEMVKRYRRTGFGVRTYRRRGFSGVTFIDVRRGRRVVMTGLVSGGRRAVGLIAIPRYFSC